MMKQKEVSAIFWSAVDIILRQGLQFCITIILARILSPKEFGIIALLYLFTGIASALVDSGFSAALIQRQDITHTDESTVFWFNLATGLFISIILAGFSPIIASFFNLSILEPLVQVLSLNILISAVGSVHGTLLNKRLDFKSQLKTGAYSTIISGALAIYGASIGVGVWALAIQTIAASIVTTVSLWSFCKWRPKFIFSLSSATRLFRFGGYLLASGILEILYNRIYSLLIGKFYGPEELGFYNRADSTRQLPGGILAGFLSRVTYPIYSSTANDKDGLKNLVKISLCSIMLINVPMMLGLAVVSKPLTLLLFGSQWLPIVPVLQILCIGGIFLPMHVINLNVLMSLGHSRLFFRIEIIKKIFGSLFIILGTFYGIIGIAWSQAIFGIIAVFINAYYTRKHLDYGAISQLYDLFPTFLISIIMAFVVYSIGLFCRDLSNTLLLSIQILIGSISFLIIGWISRLSSLNYLIKIFLSNKHVLL